jgi:hypothetical protein
VSSSTHSKVIEIPQQSISVPNECVMIYDLPILEQRQLSVKPVSGASYNISIKSSQETTFKEPIFIGKEVDLNEWEKSLKYSKKEVDDLLCKILIDFEIEPTTMNMNWLRNQVNELITLQGNVLCTDIPDDARIMLSNLVIRMTYDNLCINILP